MRRRGRPPHPDILTPREWEVLALMRDGLSNDEIAARLGVSVAGAKFHVSEILSKLGLRNRHEAARWQPAEAVWTAREALLAPFALLRRLEVGPAVGGAVAAAALAGVALLAWGVLATDGRGRRDARVTTQTGLAWAVDERTYDVPSVIVFDLARREARRIGVADELGYAQWAAAERTFVGRTVQGDGASWGPWQLLSVSGAQIATIAPAAAWVDAAGDGKQALSVQDGSGTVIDLGTLARTPLEFVNLADALFSSDGSRIAFRAVNLPDIGGTANDFTDVLVTGNIGAIPAGGRYSAMSVKSQRAAEGFLHLGLDAWSPDNQRLLLQRQTGCESEAPGCKKTLTVEVYALKATDDVIWHDYKGRLTGAQWAGPGRLLVNFADDPALRDATYPDARSLLVRLDGSDKAPLPAQLGALCCISFSPDGKYAVARVRADAGERCALFETGGWKELAALHPAPADAGRGFCTFADWARDGSSVIVSQSGN